MGNAKSGEKTSVEDKQTSQNESNQVDFPAIFSGLSIKSTGQSVRSTASCRSSANKIRTSRRKLKSSSLSDPFLGSKTVWPVTFCETPFLPEFPIQNGVEVLQLDVEGTLASGAYGEVFKVRKRDTGTFYAMKVMSKAKLLLENAVQQVKDELRIHQMCGHHPFLLPCPFHWQTRKQIFLVTEFLVGGDLQHLWKETGAFEEELVKYYIAELALALDFLHNAGIIYRDMKMENVLLDATGHARLTDFGLSKWLPVGQRTKTLCGTLQYMAPEVLQQEPYSHAVDWWGLGVVLYALLQGQFPFCVRMPAEKWDLDRIEFTDRPEISSPARNLVRGLLTVKAQQRLRNLRALQQHAFYHHFNFDTLRSKQINLVPLLERQRSRHRPHFAREENFTSFDENISVLE